MVKSLKIDCRLSDLAEILHNDTHKVPEGWIASTLEPEVEFRRKGAFYRILFWGHISGANQGIYFTKFGVCMWKIGSCNWWNGPCMFVCPHPASNIQDAP